MANKPNRRPVTTTTKPEPVEPTPEPVAVQPSVINTPVEPQEKTDEQWEQAIAAAKEGAKTEETLEPIGIVADQSIEESIEGPIADDGSTVEKAGPTPEEIEAEIRRRVEERLKAAQLEQQAPPAPTPAPVETPAITPTHATIPEIKKPTAVSDKKYEDLHQLIFTNLGTDEESVIAVKKELEADLRPDQEKRDKPTEFISGMSMIPQLGQRTGQQRLLKDWQNEITKEHPDAFKPIDRNLGISQIVPDEPAATGAPVKLTGAAAAQAVSNALYGQFRIHLYNSGFWVDLRNPMMAEIDNWMVQVDHNFTELGRVLGGHAHTITDILLKQELCKIIPTLVVDSNFELYKDPTALMDHISFHDYDTLLWGLSTMMYTDGIGIGIYCTNPDCRYVDTSQFVDLARLCYVNTARMPAACLQWMASHANDYASVSVADLDKYQEMLNFHQTIQVPNRKMVFDLGVPSLKRFCDWGAELYGRLAAELNSEKSINTNEFFHAAQLNLYKMMAPWIKQTVTLNSKDEVVRIIENTKDNLEATYMALDRSVLESDDIYDEFVKFIRDTKMTFYSATTLKCPKCGKTAELDKDNLFPLDMQYVFFDLCYLKSIRNGTAS